MNLGLTLFLHGFYFAHNAELTDLCPASDIIEKSAYSYERGKIQYVFPNEVPPKYIRDAKRTFTK
jgi:hypothetical protein